MIKRPDPGWVSEMGFRQVLEKLIYGSSQFIESLTSAHQTLQQDIKSQKDDFFNDETIK